MVVNTSLHTWFQLLRFRIIFGSVNPRNGSSSAFSHLLSCSRITVSYALGCYLDACRPSLRFSVYQHCASFKLGVDAFMGIRRNRTNDDRTQVRKRKLFPTSPSPPSTTQFWRRATVGVIPIQLRELLIHTYTRGSLTVGLTPGLCNYRPFVYTKLLIQNKALKNLTAHT
ncbi:uncharacterized protein EV420DRAFT_354138 [Desarmillaria tabescens]|uniref:Uncharacterized protein n=1 Tax=Armillaria tabescens TaxID=1929756 RepID=A0AA39KC18_ARMTA|nr:uncharacterized protein EV420DRAFT_354138 [Desarmillaria tabescens]KAK0458391.1 hypothetical protein EV420DRAFT_354138 [Desarmillaria tabescens]